MTVRNYDEAIEGLDAILENFTEESEIYKQAAKLKDDLIASQIPF